MDRSYLLVLDEYERVGDHRPWFFFWDQEGRGHAWREELQVKSCGSEIRFVVPKCLDPRTHEPGISNAVGSDTETFIVEE